MTTPSDEPAARPTEPSPASSESTDTAPDTAPTAEQSAAPAAPSAPQTPPAPYAYAYADPAFAPVARAPRTPWVNPAKRVRVAIISAAAGLALLGGGLATGFAVGHHSADRGDRGDHARFIPGRMMPGQVGPGMALPGQGDDRFGPRMRMRPGDGYGPGGVLPGMPGRPGQQAPSATATPTPSPSKSG